MRRDRKKNNSVSTVSKNRESDSDLTNLFSAGESDHAVDETSEDSLDFLNELNLSQVPFSPDILQLRKEVLHPLGPLDRVQYPRDKDPMAVHIAIQAHNELVAVGSLLPEDEDENFSLSVWRIRGMAVRSDLRGFGLGQIVLTEMFENLRALTEKTKVVPSLVWCNARVEALNLYKKFGFEVLDEEFVIPGSGPHRRLKYPLSKI